MSASLLDLARRYAGAMFPDRAVPDVPCGPRLAWDHDVSDSSPVVKGTRVTAGHVVSLIVDGWAWSDVLRAHPELTSDDVRACLEWATDNDSTGVGG
jgi:uncharacterized protein (DUF433 family)